MPATVKLLSRASFPAQAEPETSGFFPSHEGARAGAASSGRAKIYLDYSYSETYSIAVQTNGRWRGVADTGVEKPAL